MSREVGQSRAHALLVNGALLLLAAVSLAPLLWMVSVSFMPAGEASRFPPPLLPSAPTFANYHEMFARTGMARNFANSVLVSVAITLGSLLFNTLAGYAFAKLRFAGRERVFQAMAELAVEVATAVATHADEHQLDDLARLVKITEADFARARVSHRLWLAERVVASAQTVLPELASRGVTADTLQELQARINTAHANLHEPRTTVAAKKAATLRLVVLFDEVDALLEGQIERSGDESSHPLAAFWRLYPTKPGLKLVQGGAGKNWDLLLHPPPRDPVATTLPEVASRNLESSRMAILRGGPW